MNEYKAILTESSVAPQILEKIRKADQPTSNKILKGLALVATVGVTAYGLNRMHQDSKESLKDSFKEGLQFRIDNSNFIQ